MIAMKEFGIRQSDIFLDKQSGKDFERPAYKRLVKKMQAGDVLVVKSIDRLGRNYDEILEQWRYLSKGKRIEIIVLDMPILNTSNGKDLTGILIADIVLQLLSYVAQTEREHIRQRQAEGIKAAKARGVQFGRRALEIPPEYSYYLGCWKKQEISARKAAKLLSVSTNTFLKWTKDEL